jgi:hypothetical protein
MNAYPLSWPAGWPRAKRPEESRFKITFAKARDSLFKELQRMNAKEVILSTNVQLTRDGVPYARRNQPDDRGVAVYFKFKGRDMVFACDRWIKVGDNIQAVRKTIEALRGIERWGASDMLEKAFTGFVALEHEEENPWYITLNCSETSNHEFVKRAYKFACAQYHDDKPTRDPAKFDAVQKAYKHYLSLYGREAI